MNGEVMKKVVTPKGYFFRIVKDPYGGWDVKLYKRFKNSNRKIGNVHLSYEYSRCYSTHSNLEDRYHNKGLGALMYAKAIQWGLEHGYRIKSSGGSSSGALRVWRGSTLKRFFEIKVKPGRNYHDQSLNPEYDTFYPHPKKEDKCRVSSKKRPAKKRK